MRSSPARRLALASLLAASACTARVVDNGDPGTTTMLSVGDDGDHTTTDASDSQSPTTASPSDPTNSTQTTVPPGTTTDTPATDSSAGMTDPGPDLELCVRFGGQSGVEAVIGSFLGKVLVDERINAYFLTTDLDGTHLADCLAQQIGNLAGCDGINYACQDMQSAHAGMGISTQDFNDLAADFAAAMDEVPTLGIDDKMLVLEVLAGMAPDIVEDVDNGLTIYQRLGRKPGLGAVVGSVVDPQSFIALVAGDATLVSFFATSDLDRLHTCLVRQLVTVTLGPNIYGKEVTAPVPADLGVTTDNPCRDMTTAHAKLKDGMNKGIEFIDFQALLGHLVTAMTNFAVPMDDQNAIVGALGPLCASIVTVDPNQCP